MKHAQLARTLGLMLVVGLAGAVVGCGSATGSPEEEKAAGKIVAEANHGFFKSKMSQNKGAARKAGPKSSGDPRSRD